MLDQRANVEITQCFSERFLVAALVCGEAEQIARVPAGDLRTEVGITSSTGGRAMHVKNGLRVCIDEFRDLQLLYTVACSLAIVAARSRPLVERGVDRAVFRGVVQLRRLAQQHSADAHTHLIKRLTQRRWMWEIGRSEADLPDYLRHLLQQVDGHPIGRVEVNPETVEGNERIVGESAASSRSGGFVSIARDSFSDRHNFSNKAGDLGHGQPRLPASTPLI